MPAAEYFLTSLRVRRSKRFPDHDTCLQFDALRFGLAVYNIHNKPVLNYTYSVIDLRAAIDLLYSGALGSLDWIETRLLADGATAFREIHEGKAASPKIVLRP